MSQQRGRYWAHFLIFWCALSELRGVAPQENLFDVRKFGAVGDGKTDDSKALLFAWEAACKQAGNAKVTVPSGKKFLVSTVEFGGPCKSTTITFEILGTIVAPPKSQWKSSQVYEWISFRGVNGLVVVGKQQGTIDGQGGSWWSGSQGDNDRPTALRFSDCINLQVSGLRHVNSQRNHVSINNCNHATLSSLRMTAPEESPNTDGIDIGSSTYVTIRDCTIGTGDDCIAVNGGTSNVRISGVNCGPGHGISIGSLGKNGERDEVEAISVDSCNFHGTTNGVRIKTWQGGSGFARNINFTHLSFKDAQNPIIIDQFYCPHQTCPQKPSAVEVRDVRYSRLLGTCKNATISFRCSDSVPCSNIQVEGVNIQSSDPNHSPLAVCSNAHGRATGPCIPKVDCLK